MTQRSHSTRRVVHVVCSEVLVCVGSGTNGSEVAAQQRPPGAIGWVGSGGSDDDRVAVALEGLQSVATCALADQLRLVAAGCDVDRELDPECV